jgi:hypothetical protein
MPTWDDGRPAAKAAGDDARAAGDSPDGGVPPGSYEVDEPAKSRGTEAWVQAAEAGEGEVRATRETPEPDSLGG